MTHTNERTSAFLELLTEPKNMPVGKAVKTLFYNISSPAKDSGIPNFDTWFFPISDSTSIILLGMLRWSIMLSANLILTKYFLELFHLKQFWHCHSHNSPINAMAHRMSPEVSLGSFDVSTICISSSSSSLSSFSSPRVFGLTMVIALKTRNCQALLSKSQSP